MTSLLPETKMREFWTWFASAARRFESNQVDQSAIDELDAHVAELGQVVWELGPGIQKSYALVLSPDGEPDWLPVTRRIVSLAPNVPGWEFHPARPPKQWDLRFEFEHEEGSPTPIDARDWRYVMLKFPDGTFDVILEQPNTRGLSDDDRWIASIIVLDGLLGEATRMTYIGDVEPTLKLPSEYEAKATPIDRMPAHFDSLLESGRA